VQGRGFSFNKYANIMIHTIGPGGCGFTFLNWTISYLRGDNTYVLLNGKSVEVDIDPLQGSTAHNFRKDHFKIEHSKNALKTSNSLSIVYLTPGSQQDFDELLLLPGKKIIFDPFVYSKELLARACLTVPECPESITVCLNQISNRYGSDAARQMFLDCARCFVQYYVPPDQSVYPYFKINYVDMFENLDHKLLELFKFLEINIDQNRIQNWVKTYQIYKSRNVNFVERFIGNTVTEIDNSVKKNIFKEILAWKNGNRPHISYN
jgi:hypothetical protein